VKSRKTSTRKSPKESGTFLFYENFRKEFLSLKIICFSNFDAFLIFLLAKLSLPGASISPINSFVPEVTNFLRKSSLLGQSY